MADGILDGISNAVGGVGDFFLNRGRYADPNAMNAQFGVPEADVRQAGINTLANVSALLLAAGQPMSGSERAKLLAGIGPALGGMQTDIFKASQARLMTAQQREKMDEMKEIQAINERRKSDPLGLAKAMNIPVDRLPLFSGRDLRDIAKQITIKRATTEPADIAMAEAAAAAGAPVAAPSMAPAAQATTAAPSPAGAPAPAAAPAPAVQEAPAAAAQPTFGQIPNELLSALSPEARRTLQVYQRALNDPRIQQNPERVKAILENIDRLVPGAKEFSAAQGKRLGEQMAAAPQALRQSQYMLTLLDEMANDPGREAGTGVSAWMAGLPGGLSMGARAFANLSDQVSGQTFLQAYESLKGTGQITEIEGKKAEQAISRLRDRYVTEQEYLKAIKDLRDVVENSRGRLSKTLGVEYKEAPVPEVFRTLEKKPAAQPRARAGRYDDVDAIVGIGGAR
jgi:hypothetical protein